ncbi:MAG: hypothetical protein FWH28_04690, partial [Clostridiales bacterium]|nr:hypothetical protein [Clostridiales bacterium]
MRKYAARARRSILLLFAGLCFAFFWLAPPPAYAATAQVLVTQIQNISGSLVVELSPADPNVVEVSGSATISSTVVLNIDRNVTVNWAADIEGGTASGRYLLNLSGGGTFNLTGGANIRNKSGIFSVTGAGANININQASLITPLPEDGGNGTSINIAADNVSLYVNTGGSILNEGSNSAINVTAGVVGVNVNINGCSVVSAPAGYAINDGGTSLCVNDTRITVNDGEVRSGSACTIRSTGMDSVLTVMGGIVTNEATVNSNPVIYMNGGLGENVTVGGTARVVASDNGLGYGIQTT